MLEQISHEENTNLLYLYYDYSWCLLRHGCLINQYYKGHFYKQSEVVRKNAFTQRRVNKIINNFNSKDYIHILNNKNEFNTYFSSFIKRKWLYSKDMTKDQFLSLCNSCDAIFVKPLDDMEGNGIIKYLTSNMDSDTLYRSFVSQNLIIEEAISQIDKLCLNNQSVNTARILTILDSKGNAHVVRAGLRVGVGDSVVDNYSTGGVLYQIDIQTGIVDHKGIQGCNYDVIYHPNTNICMVGFQMPHWDIAISQIKKAAEMLPHCRFIGWDVAFTVSGIELIEGNHNPGIFTLESLGSPGAYRDVIRLLNN